LIGIGRVARRARHAGVALAAAGDVRRPRTVGMRFAHPPDVM
jgi:hypothetical protein